MSAWECSGLVHVLSWEKVNWLGLDSSTSFATFVSRNSAGAFLNVCLAASIGLASRAFAQPRQKEQRYAYANESPALRILHTFEDLFAQLTTPQIASLLATTVVLLSLICTNSRGAIIGGVIACIIALLASRNRKNQLGNLVFAFVVVAIGMSGLYFLRSTSA